MKRTPPRQQNPPPSHLPNRILVDPTWLLKAFLLVVGAALVCGYLSLCALFYQGQWQMVLHPSHGATVPAGPSSGQTIRFGVDASGTPQLSGVWIPAGAAARYARFTVLYLPPGDGSLADASATLSALHDLGLNVCAVDYRGYGQSSAVHPNQTRMTEDADSAWQYLSVTRGQPQARIIPYGSGIGAYLAVHLAANHPEIPAVILDSPQPDMLDRALKDPRARILPMRLLFHERFRLFPALATIQTPKLILNHGMSEDPSLREAAPPKMELTAPTLSPAEYHAALQRFLDQYLPAAGQVPPT